MVASAVALLASCAGGTEGAARSGGGGGDRPATGAGSGRSTDGIGATGGEPAGPPVRLGPQPLAAVTGDWEAVRVDQGRAWAFRPSAPGLVVLGRFDPGTGELLAERELPEWTSYTVTPDGLVVLRGSQVQVLDLDDLSDRALIDLPPGDASINADLPRRGPFWMGIRQSGPGQLAGAPARMAVLRLDLSAGTLAEVRDVTPCGAKSATQLDGDRLAFAIECAYQPAVLDLTTGEERAFDGFPDGAHVHRVGDEAWFRWKSLGYVARLRGDGTLQTLDLNADGPVLGDLDAFSVTGDAVWVVGRPASEDLPFVLHRIDPETFRVTARAELPERRPAVVQGSSGYQAGPGGLRRFATADVRGGAPSRAVRPPVGPPPAARPDGPGEAEVIDAFTTVFDPAVPSERAAPLLEEPGLVPLRDRMVAVAAGVYPGVEPRVTAVAVDGDSAAVNYVLIRDGRLAFLPLSATLRRNGSSWVVTRDGVCRLVVVAAQPGC